MTLQDTPSGGSSDDERQASSLITSLSSYVMTATLAILGAQGVIVSFVVGNRSPLTAFYWVGGAAAVSLIVSIILGGLGVNEIIRAGSKGTWKIDTERGRFNKQALLALLGAALVLVSAFLSEPAEEASRTQDVPPASLPSSGQTP